MRNLLLLFGGGSTEHEISKVTCEYLEKKIDSSLFNVFKVEMINKNDWRFEGKKVSLNFDRTLSDKNGEIIKIDLALPCIHGYPAETGDIQSYFNLIDLPFFGVDAEASKICFNKVLTKLWFENKSLPTAPYLFIENLDENAKACALSFFKKHKHIFIKASNQGSSIGCFNIENEKDLFPALAEAFNFSKYVLIESFINARELEISVFEYKGEIYATNPGEIICPTDFYDYSQKYAKDSKTEIQIQAQNISDEVCSQMKEIARRTFQSFNLKDLSRIDFFLTPDNQILLNEINTFPGMTPISLFPQMMENSGVLFNEYINERLQNI